MNVLLDTSTLIWAMTNPAKLSATALAALDGDDELLVSAASAWEIATKHRIGRLAGVADLVARWNPHLERFGLTKLGIEHGHAIRAGGYDVDHADPFDRLIAAQSELADLPVVSNDRAFDLFPVQRIW